MPIAVCLLYCLPAYSMPARPCLPAPPACPPVPDCLQMVDEDPYQLPTIDESKWFIGGHLGSQIQSVNWQVGCLSVSPPRAASHTGFNALLRSPALLPLYQIASLDALHNHTPTPLPPLLATPHRFPPPPAAPPPRRW